MTTLAWIVAGVLAVMLALVSRRLIAAHADLALARRSVAHGASSSRSAEREALRLGRILASMPDGVMVIEGGEVVYANPAAARLLGGDPVRFVPTIRTSPQPSVLVTVHHPAYREVRCIRTELESGALLVVARDVTEARRLDRMRQDFVANASHELKTPVAAIRATAETLHAAIEDDPASARRFVEALGREASRLSELVQDLLDLARLDQSIAEGNERSDAVLVARDALEGAQQRAQDAGIEIALSATGSVPVPVRAVDLVLAMRNLLDNALRHTPAGGRIEISVERADDGARIAVRDTGEGIPGKDLARIFERFYRVDRARSRDTGGTGLGLAIVKHIAETAGGTVSVDSTYGSGATFTISLPLDTHG